MKKGGLRFTTAEGRDQFSRLVLHQMRPIDKVLDLADLLNQRMLALNSGRMWVAAHMRRGDCEFVRVCDVFRSAEHLLPFSCQYRVGHGKNHRGSHEESERALCCWPNDPGVIESA